MLGYAASVELFNCTIINNHTFDFILGNSGHATKSEYLCAIFFSNRCPFHVEYQTFVPEMEFMHGLPSISPIFQTPKLCLTLNTLDGTQGLFSSLLRFVDFVHSFVCLYKFSKKHFKASGKPGNSAVPVLTWWGLNPDQPLK